MNPAVNWQLLKQHTIQSCLRNAKCFLFQQVHFIQGKKLFHLKIYIYEHVMNVLDVPCNVLWKILIRFQESWSKPAGQGGSLALSGQMQGWKKSWRGITLAWQWDLLLFHLTVFCGVLLCSDCFLSTPPRWVVGRDQLLGKIIRRIISRSPSQSSRLEANHLKRLLAKKHFSYSLVNCSLELVERRRPRTAEGCPRERES